MRILKTSLVAALAALLVFSNIAPAFATPPSAALSPALLAASVSAATLKNPSTTAKTITTAAAAPKTPAKVSAKAVPAKVVPAKVPVVPKIIKPPVPVSKAPVAPKAGIPVVPSTPPVVPALPNPPPPNTSIIDMINTIPVIGAISRDDEIKKRLEVVDPFTDVATMPGGKKVYRQYSKPRSIYQDRGQLKLRPENWNLFAELPQSQLFDRGGNGYRYSVPMGDNSTIEVRPGNYVKGATTVAPVRPAFKQSTKENSLVSEYIDMYPEIDVRFTDSGEFREREIIIKRKPRDLQLGQDLIFWEEYSLPANAEVEQRGRDVLIKKADGTFFAIGGATVLDASIDEPGEMDMSVAVKELSQEVFTDYQRGTLNIGIHIDAAYLLDEYRIYPVTIDPQVFLCRFGECPSNSDNYLRYLDQTKGTDTNYLYLGYYNVPANNPNRDPAGAAPRIPIIRYTPLNYSIPPNERLDSAYLKMTYFARSNSYCNLNQASPVTVAKRITGAWNENTITYRQIRGMLADANPGSTTQINVSPGTEFSWNITDAVRTWTANVATNNGLLIAPTPDWQNDGAPNWPQCIHLFKSIEKAAQSGGGYPYIEVNTTQVFPDLSRTNIVIPNTVRQGARLTSTFTVANSGLARSVATDVQSFFGVNSYESGLLVNTTNIPALNPGQSVNVTVNYDVPVGQAVRDYYFSFWIDRRDLVLEGNEANNKTRQIVSVTDALRPDIRAENASVNNNSVLPGDQVILSLDVYNRGAAIANDDSYVYYSFTRDIASYSADSKLVDENYFSRLDVNQSSRESLAYRIPPDKAPGTYYLSYFVDGPGNVNESNENNNQGSFQITVRAGQDLVPSNVQIVNPRTVLSGEQLTVTARIRNSGNVASNNVTYRLRLNDINTGTLYTLTNQQPASLNLSIAYDNSVNLTGTVPADIPLTGSYQVVLELDHTGSINELNEGNNIATSATILTVQRNGYCGGCGGGANPPASNTLPNSDQDSFADVEEKFAGTNVTGAQVLGLFDAPRAKYYLSSPNDTKANAYGADPVNIRTGSFEFNQKDFEVVGRGMPISIIRSYNSRVTDNNNRLGNGWSLSTQMYYYQDPGTHNVQLYLGGSMGGVFTTVDAGATFMSPPGIEDKLTNENGNLVYKTLDGVRYIFSKKLTSTLGMIERIQDTFGNTTLYSYTVQRDVPLLMSITDPSGRRVTFTYGDLNTALWDKVLTISDSFSPQNPRVISYSYDGNGNLTEVRESRTYTGVSEDIIRRFGYTNNKMVTYTDPRGTILYNEYDATGRVIRQKEFNPRVDAQGTNRIIYELTYTDVPDPAVPGSELCTVVKNYSAAQIFTTQKMCFNLSGLKIFDQDGAGNITRISYDGSGMPSMVTDPNGTIHQYTFDGRRRLTQEILPDTAQWHTVVSYTYENNFNKLVQKEERVTSRVDVNIPPVVRTTQYEINVANGSVSRITDPLTNSESFVYDQFGNATRHTNKNGGITNYIYDANGNYQVRKTTMLQQVDASNQTITTQYSYDSYGNKLIETMPNGALYTYEYDSVGNLRKTTDPTGAITLFRYDLESHKISQTDALGHVTNFSYDTDIEESLLSSERVGANSSLVESNEYDYLGNVTRQIDARGNVIRYVRDGAGKVIQRIEPLTTMSMTYDANGNVTREVRGVGVLDQRIDYSYDARNNLVSVRRYNDDGSFVESLYSYDGFNNKITSTDGNGGVTLYGYDLAGRLTSITDPLANESRYVYDAGGNKTGEVSARAVSNPALRNANGHTITYQYDALNRLIKKTNAVNKESLMFYDEQSHVVRSVDNQDSNGGASTHITRFEFNSRGLKTRQIDANGNAVVYEYDSLGNLTRQLDVMNRATIYVYDEFGRLVEERNAAGNSVIYVYDANGNKTSVTLADGSVTTSVYDAQNRITRITDAVGESENYAYDVVGNKTRVTSKSGAVTNFSYDGLNRLIREENAQNTVTTYVFDENGNRLNESTNGVVKSYEFNSNNNVTRILHPGNNTEIFTYDANGNLATKTDGNGTVTRLTYDALDRTTQKQLGDNSTVSYGYDNWNNVVQLTEPVGTTQYTFDAGNRLISEQKVFAGIDGNSYTISRVYNPDNQLASLTDAANKQITYSYTNVGLLSSVMYQNEALATYAYNSNGKPTSLTYRNGIVQNYSYDALQRPTSLSIQNAQQQNLFTHNYSYDADSNRTQTIEATSINGDTSNRTIDYSYDTVDQLTGVNYSDVSGNSDLSFGYDTRGNRLSLSTPHARTSYSYTNGTEELAHYSTNDRMSVSMSYDGNGALTRESYSRLGKSQKNVDYRWNTQNRLSQITVTDTTRPAFLPSLPVNTLDFAYDDAGNRVKKSVNNTDTTYYLNNGLVVLDELSGAGVVSKTIVQGLNEQIAQIDARGVITFTHPDTQGTALMLSNEQGVVVQQYDYDPFGGLIGSVAAAGLSAGTQSKYLYTNQEFDVESNLYYYNARYYNPTTGRFISRDLIPGNVGDTLSRNAYIYVKNNPLRYTDPSGLWFDDFLSGVSSAVSSVGNAVSNVATAVKDKVVDTAVAVKSTVSQVTTAVVTKIENVQWKTVGVGLLQTGLGVLQTTFGATEVASGFAIGAAGTAGTAGIGAVPAIAAGIAVGALGANNVVAGGTQTLSGLATIWNGLSGKKDVADMTYNPAHEAINAVTDEGSTANKIATFGFDMVDLVAGAGAASYATKLAYKGIGATGQIGESALQQLGGKPQQFFRVPGTGGRYIDQVVNSIGHESKVGYQTLTSTIKKQISKDKWLVENGDLESAVWNFYRSPVTGKVGASDSLLQSLTQNNIKYVINDGFTQGLSFLQKTAITSGVSSKLIPLLDNK